MPLFLPVPASQAGEPSPKRRFRSHLETFGTDVGYIRVMTKCCLVIVSGLFGLSFTLSAQQIEKGIGLNSLRTMSGRVPALTLADARSFPLSAPVAWIAPATRDFL